MEDLLAYLSLNQRFWVGIAAGYFWSLALGQLVVGGLMAGFKHCLGKRDKPAAPVKAVPAAVTGLIERFIFTTFTTLAAAEALVAMGAWLGIKLASNWHQQPPERCDLTQAEKASEWLAHKREGFQALLGGLVSLFMAGTGGYLALWLRGAYP